MTTAPGKFRTFLKDRNITLVAAAKALGVSHPTVFDWINARKRPRATFRKAIAKYTRNAVRVDDWEDADEKNLVSRVRPFRARAA